MRFDPRSSCVEVRFLTHAEKFSTPAELDPGLLLDEVLPLVELPLLDVGF